MNTDGVDCDLYKDEDKVRNSWVDSAHKDLLCTSLATQMPHEDVVSMTIPLPTELMVEAGMKSWGATFLSLLQRR